AAAADLPPPGEAAAAVPAPGEVQKPAMADIPAPGEVKKPIDIPAPGEVSKPADIPAPGEVRAPAPTYAEPAVAPKRDHIADDPMSGGSAFDPNAGLIDDVGGEIKSGGGIGLPIFAGVIGILVGVGLGWMAHKSTDSRSRVDAAKKKAAVIEAKVNSVEETRATIAMRVGEAQDALAAKEAEKAVEALSGLEPTFVELGDLFGWQMAAMDPTVIKNIFDLAEANNSLQLDVGILKGWVAANSEILAGRTGGPSSFVVIRSPSGGAILAEYVSAICADIPDPLPEGFDPNTLEKCEGDEILSAKAFLVRTAIGGETSIVPGDQAMMLIPDGPIYTYAIGATPDANAKAYFDIRMGRINEVLANMVKLKDEALEGIGNYTKDPPVDGG
ncbi:MAG TPA: hypothetical protein VK034_02040, partial [Enhygromyxa sp.]|nr:hypothetical protein [Enhygromyxa sp.]